MRLVVVVVVGQGAVVPVVVDVELSGLGGVSAAGVRSLLSRFVVDPVDRHADQEKSYRAGEVVASGPRARWRVAWAAPEEATGWDFSDVVGSRLGGPQLVFDGVRVERVSRRDVSFQELAGGAVTAPRTTHRSDRRTARVVVGMAFRSPTVFRRGPRAGRVDGVRRWWPVMDPVMVFDSVARGWARWAPEGFGLERGVVEEVLDRVVVRQPRLRTRRVGNDAGRGRSGAAAVVDAQVGFVGDAMFELAGHVSEDVQAGFMALSRFAGVHGIGAQRCYGFGDVEVRVSGVRHGDGGYVACASGRGVRVGRGVERDPRACFRQAGGGRGGGGVRSGSAGRPVGDE
jgi:hypothetical protein